MSFLSDTARGWKRRRRARAMQRATNRAWMLLDNRPYDLVLLHERGFVKARATGQDITCIHAKLENMLNRPVRVLVKAGVYFHSSGAHQNMATTKSYEVDLQPGETREIAIDATCINADRPIPGTEDYFEGVFYVDRDEARFLEASRGRDRMTVQAGIWAITDQMSRFQVKERLVSRDSGGDESHPIEDKHVDEAKSILNRLKIHNYL